MRLLKFCFIFVFHFLVSLHAAAPDREIMMPMRDGFEIPTSLYFPKEQVEATKKYPCILVRHPLGREHADELWLQLVNEGYVVAVQATRSSCDTTGKSLPYVTDAVDGHDAVEWLGTADFCDGSVATVGASAAGITSYLLAPEKPKHLVCQYIEVAPPSLYQYAVWPGGQFRKEQVEGWLKAHRRDPSVVDWLHTQTTYNDFWRQFNMLEKASGISAPQVHVGGWFDIFLQGTIDAFQAANNLSEKGVRSGHKLIIGPWGHRWKKVAAFGDFSPQEAGRVPPKPISIVDWFNAHMKKAQNGALAAPTVQYFVMGPFDGSPSKGNRWREAHKWPPDNIALVLYLSEDGSLKPCRKAPEKKEDSEQKLVNVTFDPQNPVPTIGGRNLFMPDGPRDLSSIEGRPDVVTFTTAALEEDTEVTGRLLASLFLKNVAQERDVCLRLSDVYPDGKSILIAEGVSHVIPETKNATVDMWSTSMVFAKGHKIRLDISGSNFPAYEASLKPNPTDSNICFSLATSSFLSLPVIPS